MDSPVNFLLNNDEHFSKSNSEKSLSIISESADNVIAICKTLLTYPTYDPSETLDLLKSYINAETTFNRLLYSQISTFVFNLSDEESDTFTHNLSYFFENAIETSEEYDTMLNTVFKFYDHAELALRQKNLLSSNAVIREQSALRDDLEKIQADFKESEHKLTNTESEFNNTIKNTQRDYITIFGIFSAIIISFVGGISFSSAILESISVISIYRLIAIICLLAFVLFNVVYYLISVVLKISSISIDKSIGIKKLRLSIPTFFNMMTIVILIADCLLYYINK